MALGKGQKISVEVEYCLSAVGALNKRLLLVFWKRWGLQSREWEKVKVRSRRVLNTEL